MIYARPIVFSISKYADELPAMVETEHKLEHGVEICSTYNRLFKDASLTRLLVTLSEGKYKVTQMEQLAIDKIHTFLTDYSLDIENNMSYSVDNLRNFLALLTRNNSTTTSPLIIPDDSISTDREINHVVGNYGMEHLLVLLRIALVVIGRIQSRIQ